MALKYIYIYLYTHTAYIYYYYYIYIYKHMLGVLILMMQICKPGHRLQGKMSLLNAFEMVVTGWPRAKRIKCETSEKR